MCLANAPRSYDIAFSLLLDHYIFIVLHPEVNEDDEVVTGLSFLFD